MARPFLEIVDIVGKSASEFLGEKIFVSTSAVDTNHINPNEIEIVTFQSRPARANLCARESDVLFAKMFKTNKALLLTAETADNIYSTVFFAVRAKKSVISSECLFYFVTSEQFLTQKDKNCTGATQKAIAIAGLEKISVNIPSIEVQEKAVKQLDLLERLISLRKRQLAKLDELVKARFVEMFGDPVDNKKRWTTKPLEEVCSSIVDCPHSTPSYTHENTGFMCIRTSIVKKNQIIWGEIEYIPETEYVQRIQRKKPEKGDVIYTREGAILGIAAVIDRECNVALGQRSMLLSPDKKKCTSEFLSVAMNFDSFLHNALKEMSGSASPHINVGDIKAFPMIMPPVEQQEAFSLFIKQINKQKLTIQQSIDKLETLKKTLMQDYFG